MLTQDDFIGEFLDFNVPLNVQGQLRTSSLGSSWILTSHRVNSGRVHWGRRSCGRIRKEENTGVLPRANRDCLICTFLYYVYFQQLPLEFKKRQFVINCVNCDAVYV